jgi:hypothetical protein
VRVLFLDIDGVLNHCNFLMGRGGRRFATEDEENLAMLDPVACLRLERVLAATGAVIVLSSSWRIRTKPPAMESLLHRRGVASARVIDETPTRVRAAPDSPLVFAAARGHEIQGWLDTTAHDVDSFAIVDDTSDMAHLRDRLVLTSWAAGMLDEHADALIAMLGSAA